MGSAALKKLGFKPIKLNPKNPAEAAADLYESLHGRPSSETIEIRTPVHEHSHLTAWGELVALVIEAESGRRVRLKKFEDNRGRPAYLSTNENRTQLFIDGGDQRVDVSDFGIRGPVHEKEYLGELVQVDYFTTKDHLGRDGGEAVYQHKFSKRRRPQVIYDTRNGLLEIAGGRYTNEDEGITN